MQGLRHVCRSSTRKAHALVYLNVQGYLIRGLYMVIRSLQVLSPKMGFVWLTSTLLAKPPEPPQ